MDFERYRLNPSYPYLRSELAWRKTQAEIWLRVARERGKEDHPAARIMQENLTLIKEMERQ